VDVPVAGAVRGGGGLGRTLSWPAVVARRKEATDLLPSKASIDDACLRGAICGSSSSSSNTRMACSPPRSSAGMAASLQPSCVEALPPSGWSSTPSYHQVVCPRWFHGVQRRRSFAGFGCSSICAQFLGGDALRMPVTGGGGGGTRGPDCFSSICSRVFFAILEGLSSNSRFLSTTDAKGPLCNLYPPRVC
jgi:hypothetical protein